MQNFKTFLLERFVSIGFKPEDEHQREKHRKEIHDILRKSYSAVPGGYGGLGSGSEEESKAIHDDINQSLIKATKRDGKITAVNLYKKKYGRKSIAVGHDGTDRGKSDWRKIATEDITRTERHAWGEASGAALHVKKKLGNKPIPYSVARKIVNKPDMKPVRGSTTKYTRKIGKERHEKEALGNPKLD